MTFTEDELRALLEGAAPAPRVTGRAALLDSLVARVEAGGADVAAAPMPDAPALAVATLEAATDDFASDGDAPSSETAAVVPLAPARRLRRIGAAAAGMSATAWVAVGIGSAAAAAAGAWMLTHGFDGSGIPDDADQPVIVDRALDDSDTAALGDVLIGSDLLPTAAPDLPDGIGAGHATSAAGDGAAPATASGGEVDRPRPGEAHTATEDADASGSETRASGADGRDGAVAGSEGTGAGGSGAGGAGGGGPASGGTDADSGLVDVTIDAPLVGDVASGAKDVVDETLDGVTGGVKDTVGGLEDTVVDLVPEGPLQDTVAPVIDGVNLSGLVAWLLDSLLCAADSAVSVTASDNVGVDDVDLAIGVGNSTLIDLDLARGGGDTWTGAVAPLSVLDLGVLNRVVNVEVTATDAAGNTATMVTEKTVEVLSCLG